MPSVIPQVYLLLEGVCTCGEIVAQNIDPSLISYSCSNGELYTQYYPYLINSALMWRRKLDFREYMTWKS